jgi:hypothetical protein
VVVPGAVDLYLGRLSALLRRDEKADCYFAAALGVHESLDAAYLTALTQLDRADALRARDLPGDRDRAVHLTTAASATALAHGFDGLARRIAVTMPD